MSKPDLTKLHRSELEAIVVDQAKTAERFRRSIANIVRDFEDEGDRVYLGSSNDADELIELDSKLSDGLNWLECPWMHGADLYADLRALRAEKKALLDDIAVMMSEFVDNWPPHKKVSTSLALIAKTIRTLLDPPKHDFWGAGEPDCPREIKAGNGELHTLRCKVCGQDDPRDNRCLAQVGAHPKGGDSLEAPAPLSDAVAEGHAPEPFSPPTPSQGA